MNHYYTKLFHSILSSSVWGLPDGTRLVWITLLAMTDRNGEVSTSVPGLAHAARVSRETCELALTELSSPDLDSRSKESEGRRIEKIEGGWRLINHDKFRLLASADERRERDRARKAATRASKKMRPEGSSAGTVVESAVEEREEQFSSRHPVPSTPIRSSPRLSSPVRGRSSPSADTNTNTDVETSPPLPLTGQPPQGGDSLPRAKSRRRQRAKRVPEPDLNQVLEAFDEHPPLRDIPGLRRAVANWHAALSGKGKVWATVAALGRHLKLMESHPTQALEAVQLASDVCWTDLGHAYNRIERENEHHTGGGSNGSTRTDRRLDGSLNGQSAEQPRAIRKA